MRVMLDGVKGAIGQVSAAGQPPTVAMVRFGDEREVGMFCSSCGAAMGVGDTVCRSCGSSAAPTSAPPPAPGILTMPPPAAATMPPPPAPSASAPPPPAPPPPAPAPTYSAAAAPATAPAKPAVPSRVKNSAIVLAIAGAVAAIGGYLPWETATGFITQEVKGPPLVIVCGV